MLSIAINGVDFVEGAEPIEYYFFTDPDRYLNLLDLEFGIYISSLQGAFLIHFIISWCFRHRYYRLYLRVKHFVKNRTVWRHATYGTMEMELPVREKGKGKSTRTSIA